MSRALSIAVVCFPSFGGSGVIAAELAAGLARRGHAVHLVSSASPSRALPGTPGLSIHCTSTPEYPLFEHQPQVLALASRLIELARRERIDLIHAHYAIPHAAAAHLARQALGAEAPSVVVTLHGTDVTRVGADPSYREITRAMVAASHGVTVPSRFLAHEAYLRLGLDRRTPIEIIANFVDTERFAPPARRERERFRPLFTAAREHEDGPILFHVSNFRPLKRVIDLIEVMARVRARVPARLVMVGDGPDRAAALDRARALGVSPYVAFLGQRAEFIEQIQHADVFVLPSETESFGLAALEAMSCGVPVVGYRVGGLPELVDDTVGRLAEPFHVDALAEAVLDIVTRPDLRVALGESARSRAILRHGREPAIDRYAAYLNQIAGQDPSGDTR